MGKDEYLQIQTMGVKFQLNLSSLKRMYGKDVQKKANYLQKLGMYEYVGTDLHKLVTLHMVSGL